MACKLVYMVGLSTCRTVSCFFVKRAVIRAKWINGLSTRALDITITPLLVRKFYKLNALRIPVGRTSKSRVRLKGRAIACMRVRVRLSLNAYAVFVNVPKT